MLWLCVFRARVRPPAVLDPFLKAKAVRFVAKYQKPKSAWKLVVQFGLNPAEFPDIKQACVFPEMQWLVNSLSAVRRLRVVCARVAVCPAVSHVRLPRCGPRPCRRPTLLGTTIK